MEVLKRLKLDNLITHEFDFDDAAKAYDMVENRPGEVIQAIFKYNE